MDRRPARFLALAALLGSAACAPSFPPIAAAPGDARLKYRIAVEHPPGSSAAALRARLAAEGFTLLEDPVARAYSALDIPPNVPCFSTTRIDWTEDGRGRVKLIQAARHSCS